MPENNKTKQIAVSISEQDYEKLTYLARENCRTISGYLRWLLHQHFKKLNAKNKSDEK